MKGFLCEKPSFLPLSLERGRGGSSKPSFLPLSLERERGGSSKPVFWGGEERDLERREEKRASS